jgi:DNA repair protein RadD
VFYQLGMTEISEFVCLEHKGYARDKAVRWWSERSTDPVPVSIDDALHSIYRSGIREPKKVVLEPDGKYLRVVRVLELEHRKPMQPEEVPF